jgi:peptidoglycan hydrolase-like protein with peptidoglycan-binding domain
MSNEVPLERILTLGGRGNDVLAVRRALAKAGFGRRPKRPFTTRHRTYGPGVVRTVKRFQRAQEIEDDGDYGEITHGKLVDLQCFDAFGIRLLHLRVKAPAASDGPGIQLPKTQTTTHETGGLVGFPARDYFARPGTRCFAPEAGKLTRHTGRDPALGGDPGGPLGFSLYYVGRSGNTYYGTHLAKVAPLGQYRKSDVLATVANGPPTWSVPHIHWGIHQGQSDVALQSSTSSPPPL